MVEFGQSGCIRAEWLFTGRVVAFWEKSDCILPRRFYSGKLDVYGQKCCNWANWFYFGLKWLFSGKEVVLGQSGFFWEKICCSGCIWAKVVVFEESGSIWAKWLHIRRNAYIRAKVVVFGQKWLYSGKVVFFREKVFVIGQNCL